MSYADRLASSELAAVFGDVATRGYRLSDCHVVALCRVNAGGVPFVLATAGGEQFQVDVLRKDQASGSREAIATTDEFAVYLLNKARGSSATNEQQGLAAMALARELASRGIRADSIPGLTTLADRHAAFPAGIYRVLA